MLNFLEIDLQYCTKCPPGYYCPSTTSSQETECPDGTYSKGGQQSCTDCPAGYACPSKTDDFRIQCSAGYYTLGNSQVCILSIRNVIVFT